MATSAQKQRHRSWLDLWFFLGISAVIALLVDFAVYRFTFARPAHDQIWYLFAGSRTLAGVHLYGPQLADTNPPLITWFSALACFLAACLHRQPVFGLKLIVSVMAVASAGWCARMLRTVGLATTTWLSWLAFFATLAVEVSMKGPVFGQREHLLILLLLPYVLYAASGTGAGLAVAERIALGLAAGLSICFKPQQTLVVIGLELFLVLWFRNVRRLLRLELLVLTGTACAYVLAVCIAAPLYLRTFVPLLRDTYWAFGGRTAASLLRQSKVFDFAVLFTILVWALLRRFLRFPVAPLALLACSLSALAAFCVQHTGWDYQAVPQKVFLASAIGWMALDLLSRFAAPFAARFRPAFFALASALLVAATLPGLLLRGQRSDAIMERADQNSFVQQVVSRYAPGTTVYVFSTSASIASDVFQNHLVWGSRYAHLWMLPAVVQNEIAQGGGPPPGKVLSAARVQQLGDLQRSTVAEDLHTWKPTVVVMERCDVDHICQGLNAANFNMLAWFLRNPNFATEWQSYRLQQSNAWFDVYTRTN